MTMDISTAPSYPILTGIRRYRRSLPWVGGAGSALLAGVTSPTDKTGSVLARICVMGILGGLLAAYGTELTDLVADTLLPE